MPSRLAGRTRVAVSPAFVKAVNLQLQPDLLVVLWVTALATLLVAGLTLALALASMALARPLVALLEVLQHTSQLRLFQRSGPLGCPT